MGYARKKAEASGAATLAQMRRELKQGWPTGLTVLTGDDMYHLDAAQRELIGALVPPDTTDLALTVYGDQRVDLSTVIGAARSIGMFAPRRVVLVRDLAALDGESDPLTAYAKEPPPASYLLVRAPSLDRRRKLHQALVQHGRLLTFTAPAVIGAALEREIAGIATAKGLKLERGTAGFIAEVCGGDYYRIAAELEKVRAWLASESAPSVSVETMREVVAASGLMSGWEVADAVQTRDAAGALAAVRRLVQGGDEPIRMIGGLAWRARMMLQAKALEAGGAGGRQIVQRVRAWGPAADRLIEGLRCYSLPELLRFPALLVEADRMLKSSSLDAGAVMEQLVARLTARSGVG